MANPSGEEHLAMEHPLPTARPLVTKLVVLCEGLESALLQSDMVRDAPLNKDASSHEMMMQVHHPRWGSYLMVVGLCE